MDVKDSCPDASHMMLTCIWIEAIGANPALQILKLLLMLRPEPLHLGMQLLDILLVLSLQLLRLGCQLPDLLLVLSLHLCRLGRELLELLRVMCLLPGTDCLYFTLLYDQPIPSPPRAKVEVQRHREQSFI